MVGGVIRDELLGVPNNDVDFSVEADSYESMRDFILARGRIFKEDPEFFTIRAHIDNLNGWKGDADFVLCRKEYGYSDGRRPDRVDVGTITDDLSRRDFTMNAIAKMVYPDIETEYYDPFNGIRDIERGIIRCVGNPRKRMTEDSLRMLRAVRFSVTKDMRIHADISDILKNARYLEMLRNNVSVDRKRDELTKMFKYSTIESLRVLCIYPGLAVSVLGDDEALWLKPTTEKK
jgi:tRNA nucleotidyltransferase (CCA-adding enzyme)